MASFADLHSQMLEAAARVSRELVARCKMLEDQVRAAAPDRSITAAERFEGQQIARSVLLKTGNYRLVYEWYEGLKTVGAFVKYNPMAPSSTRRELNGLRDGYGFLSGAGIVLECGAGEHPIGLGLAGRVTRWIASDINPPGNKETMAGHLPNAASFHYQYLDATTMEGWPSASVDVVISRSLVEHFLEQDLLTHLRAARRVLRAGGKLVLMCPSSVSPPSEVSRQFGYRTPQGLHIREWSYSEIAPLIQKSGFGRVRAKLISIRGTRFLPLWIQRRNFVSRRVATLLEGGARRTNAWAFGGPLRSRVWNMVWGHLGAANTFLLAEVH